MKKLFLYYSYTGNGDVVARHLGERGYEVRAIHRKRPLPRAFLLCMLTGGFLASIHHKDKLLPYDGNVAEYDEIVVGSPIWNGNLASPVNTLLAELNAEGKTLSFVLYTGGGKAPKAVSRLQKNYPGAPIVVLKEPKKYAAELDKINALIGGEM